MPRANQFRHQRYQSDRPTSPYHLLPAICPTQPSTADFSSQLAAAGARFGKANVAAIYCVHGTFAGNDALGALTELARFSPELSKSLRKLGKRTVDLVAGETGNYTPEYVATMQSGLSAGAGRVIPVRLFNWSSQNNHIGRADGAIRLLDELERLAAESAAEGSVSSAPRRVVLWGHSHGGNVFALLTNLLGADAKAREDFFAAARSFYRPWFCGDVDMPVWPRMEELLQNADHPLRDWKLDIVTFGTPIRYGWDTEGCANLLHFIHHRPVADGPEYLAPQSIEVSRLLKAQDGDYIQHLGIAGTNLAATILSPRTFLADWRLDKYLERDTPREGFFKRLKHGTRVPEEGTTLLVDYAEVEPGLHNHLAGHALYTRRKWLPFHCLQVADRFYGAHSIEAS